MRKLTRSYWIVVCWMMVAAGALAQSSAVRGAVKDQTGAMVVGAQVALDAHAGGAAYAAKTNRGGDFEFASVAAGDYTLRVTASGFAVTKEEIHVGASEQVRRDVVLKPAVVRSGVRVEEPAQATTSTTVVEVRATDNLESRNTAEMLRNALGVELRANGELSTIPMIHGLGDERVKLVVDGMTVSSACPNHMNPPLSYSVPEGVKRVMVVAGITPVSLGGDSLGGTVAIDSAAPQFAETSGKVIEKGSSNGFYRSNGESYGGSVSEWIAGHTVGFGYNGTWQTNDDYTDGAGHKVTSTYAQTTDHVFLLAAQHGGDLVTLQAGLHHTPYQGFVGAQMDMARNVAESANLRWRHAIEKGELDVRAYWQAESHNMNIGHDKSTMMMSMFMPMNTHGVDVGYAINFVRLLDERTTLRVGNELHRFTLNDAWPPVAGTAPMMGPNTFVSIKDGHRLRLGTYVEAASKWNAHWSTLLGVRNDTVWTNSSHVQGYSDMYAADAAAFNAAKRAHTDANFDLTATARYDAGSAVTVEFGYARKSRSPNLYERYAWSTNWMASGMIGWFNDGNYYVGYTALKAEASNTIATTLILRHAGEHAAELKLAPYLNYITNYIDVNKLQTTVYGMSTFSQLQFANHAARTYGGDLSAAVKLWSGGSVNLLGGWLHGDQLDSHTPLYQMMPMHAMLTLKQEAHGFNAAASLEAVDKKHDVDPNRFEQQTPGYALFNLSGGYHRGPVEFNAGVENLFNRAYQLPLGGVNFDDFIAGMWMGTIEPLTGRGRSASLRLNVHF